MDKIPCYTPNLLRSPISVSSENSVSYLTTPSDPPQLFVLTYDGSNYFRFIEKYESYLVRLKIGYYSRKRDKKICKENPGSISPHDLIKTSNFITVMFFPVMVQRLIISSCNIKNVGPIVRLVDVFASLPSFTLPVDLVFVGFFHFPLITPCSNHYVCSSSLHMI